MHRSPVVRLVAVCFLTIFATASVALAGTRSRLDTSVFAPLQAPLRAGVPLKIENLPLVERSETILLEEFDVLAPGAVIEIADKQGKQQRVPPQPMRQFRGMVAGDPTSIVYLSITRGTRLDGMIISHDRKFALWSTGAGRPVPRERSEKTDVFIEEISADDMNESAGFMCDVEKMRISETSQGLPKSIATSELNAKPNAAPTGTQKTMLNLAIVADDELYANFSSNAANEETFLRNLVGATSTIYSRDLNTEIRIPYLLINTGGDPFAAVPGQSGATSLTALLEFGDYWHNTPPSALARSAAALISGKSQLSGIAWIETTCSGDFLCSGGNCGSTEANGHYGGGYSFNGGIGLNSTDRTVPDPNALANFGAPGSGYWPLFELAHEFGHNVQSPHTHCVTLSPADQATYGRTYVDNCYTGECYVGATSLPADGAGGRGTLMSYCHLPTSSGGVGSGGGGQTRYTFGQASEASHKIVDQMRARLDVITPAGLSTITAPSSVPPGAGGQAASVTNTAGLTFDWTITNGTFTGGGTTATGASVTFTGNTNPVTLKVVATNSSGCSITDSKTVTVTSVAAPTGVVATGSLTGGSVTVAWTNAGGATSYNVYRSPDNVNFTKISTDGTVTSTPYVDNTAVAGTAYVYKVRSVASATESTDSNKDFAVPMAYTDSTIAASATAVNALHFTQLATAANALRTMASLGAISFTQGTPAASGTIRKSHVTELRNGIDLARTTLGFSAGTYGTDGTITIGVTTIKKAVVDELRAALQ